MSKDPRPTGSRVSARWRIVGWLLATIFLGQLAIVVTVDSTLRADVARRANEEVTQELAEFRDLASDGLDPETARPFTSGERIVEVFLNRQRPETGEYFFGHFADGRVRELYGPGTRDAQALDLPSDAVAMAEIARSESGIMPTDVGEMRWGKVELRDQSDRPAGRFVVAFFVSEAAEEVERIVRLLIGVCFGVLLLTTLVSWLVAGQILKPVRTMRRTAEAISAHDLDQRLPVHGRDDIAALGLTVNTLLDRLHRSLTTERRFVDTAGHELRDPIRRARRRLAGTTGDPRLDAIEADLVSMERTLDDLDVLTSARRAGFVAATDTTTSALADAVSARLHQVADRDWRLVEVSDTSLRADVDKIVTAAEQLAENAAQHSPPDSPIDWWIRSVDDDTGVELAVRDRGPGITQEVAETVFSRFSAETDSAENRRATEADDAAATDGEPGDAAGSGLGLAVVRAIAEAHGGTAFVESEPGRGATFGLTIPRTATATTSTDTTSAVNRDG